MYTIPGYNVRVLSASDGFGAFLFDQGQPVVVDLAGIFAPVGPQNFDVVQDAVEEVLSGSSEGMSISTEAYAGERPFGLTNDRSNFNDTFTYGFLGAHVQGYVSGYADGTARFSGELYISEIPSSNGLNDIWDANLSIERDADFEAFTWLARYFQEQHGAQPYGIEITGRLEYDLVFLSRSSIDYSASTVSSIIGGNPVSLHLDQFLSGESFLAAYLRNNFATDPNAQAAHAALLEYQTSSFLDGFNELSGGNVDPGYTYEEATAAVVDNLVSDVLPSTSPKICITDATALEGGLLIFRIELDSTPTTFVSAAVQTYLNGTVEDYEGGRTIISFSAGSTNLIRYVSVQTNPDDLVEGMEVMYVALENVHGAVIANPTDAWAAGRIVDNTSNHPNADGVEEVDTGITSFPDIVTSDDEQTVGGSNVAITAFGATASGASSGTSVEVTYTVTNLGDERTARNEVDIVLANTADLQSGRRIGDTFSVPELEPGESRTYTRTADLPISGNGNFFLGADVRSISLGHNTDESDDYASVAFSIAPGLSGTPDLHASLANDDYIFRPEQVYEVPYTVSTNAFGAPGHRHALVLSRDETVSTDDIVLHNGFDSGLGYIGTGYHTGEISIPDSVEDGIYWLLAVADSDNRVAENREDNNVAGRQIIVASRPDDANEHTNLVASHIQVEADVLTVGQSYSFIPFAYTDTFDDPAPLEGINSTIPYNWMMYLSTDEIASDDDIPLRGSTSLIHSEFGWIEDSSRVRALPGWIASGEYYIYFRADIFDVIQEDIEEDNVSALTPITILNSNVPSIQAQDDVVDVSSGSAVSVDLVENDLELDTVETADLYVLFFEGQYVGESGAYTGTHALGFSYEISRDGTFTVDASSMDDTLLGPVTLRYELRRGDVLESSLGTITVHFGGREIDGTNSRDVLTGGELNDTITGLLGDDSLQGGAGDDQLDGGDGDDTVLGGLGNDTLLSGDASDYLIAGEGNDSLVSVSGTDWLDGGAGADVIQLSGNSYHTAGYVAFNVSSDTQAGTQQRVSLEGLLRIEATTEGGSGADVVQLSDESDAFFLHDAFSGFHSSITLHADYVGNQSAARFSSIETIHGMGGNDVIDLTSPDYSLLGFSMSIFGGSGNDIIWGSDATESIQGGGGNDTLFGGVGGDTLVGGAGADTFEFTHTSGGTMIEDLNLLQGDEIALYFTDGVSFNPTLTSISVEGDEIAVEFLGVPGASGISPISSYSILLGAGIAEEYTSEQILGSISIM